MLLNLEFHESLEVSNNKLVNVVKTIITNVHNCGPVMVWSSSKHMFLQCVWDSVPPDAV